MAVWSYADYATAQADKASWAAGDVIVTATGLRMRKWNEVLEAGGLLPIWLWPGRRGNTGTAITSGVNAENSGAITGVTRLTGLIGGQHPVNDAGMEVVTNVPTVTIDTTTDPTKTTISVDAAGQYQIQSAYKLTQRDWATIMVIDELAISNLAYVWTGRTRSPSCWQRSYLTRTSNQYRWSIGWTPGTQWTTSKTWVDGLTVWHAIADRSDSPTYRYLYPGSIGLNMFHWSDGSTYVEPGQIPFTVGGEHENVSPFIIRCGTAATTAGSLTTAGIGLYRVETNDDKVLVP